MHRPHVNRARTAFLALVAANVGLFAWAYAVSPPDPPLRAYAGYSGPQEQPARHG